MKEKENTEEKKEVDMLSQFYTNVNMPLYIMGVIVSIVVLLIGAELFKGYEPVVSGIATILFVAFMYIAYKIGYNKRKNDGLKITTANKVKYIGLTVLLILGILITVSIIVGVVEVKIILH